MHGSPIYLDGEAAVCGAATVRGRMTVIQGKLGKRKQHSRVSGTATHPSPRSITESRYAANGTQTHREHINPHRTHRKRVGWVSRRGCTKMKKKKEKKTHDKSKACRLPIPCVHLLGEVGALVHRALVDGGPFGEDEQPQREPVAGEHAQLLLQVGPAAPHHTPHRPRHTGVKSRRSNRLNNSHPTVNAR